MHNLFLGEFSQSTVQNQDSSDFTYYLPLDQEFRPRLTLPVSIQEIRKIVFGEDPDYLMLAYRSLQAGLLLESHPKLSKVLNDRDPVRVPVRDLITKFVSGRLTTEILSDHTANPVAVLTPEADPSKSGRMIIDLVLEVTGETEVTLFETYPRQRTSVITVSVTSGITEMFQAPKLPVAFHVPAIVGYRARVSGFIHPVKTWASIVKDVRALGSGIYADLFLTTRPDEDRGYLPQIEKWWRSEDLPLSDQVPALVSAIFERSLLYR